MSLTAHRPARPVSSLVADDPMELAADLPHLPDGIILDPDVLQGAACGEDDLELFYPDPGDLETERAAKALCAGCPVREPCLEMALATGPGSRRTAPWQRARSPAPGTRGAEHGRPPARRRQRHGAGLGAVQDRRD